MVRFDLLFHLRLDLLEVFGRNAVRQFDVVIESVLDRRPGGELRFRPDFQNRRREDMRRRMTQRSMSVIWARCSKVLRSSAME